MALFILYCIYTIHTYAGSEEVVQTALGQPRPACGDESQAPVGATQVAAAGM